MKGYGGEGASGHHGPIKDYPRGDEGSPSSPPSMKPLWIGLGILIAIAAITGLIYMATR